MTYTYDKQNQLVSARYSGSTTDTISYTYDTAGNILTEGHGGVITRDYTYAYNDASTSNDAWHDLLVAADGHAITYDGSGNPLTYYNGYKTFTSLTWEQGRQLASVTTGGKTTSYTYDADGIRKTKTIPINQRGLTCTYTFVTQNGKVVRQSWRTESIDFFYDESGRPFAMTYQRANDAPQTYYYVLNLQGDVVKLVDVSGAEVASYEYDAWGNVLLQSGSMASTNPLRYRGYYRDSETGFYYLQSRYYDPANRRFINADSYAGTGQGILGYNMFAYCSNNPVRRVDSAGCWWGEDAWDWICDKGGEALDWAGDKLEEAADWIADTAVVVWDKVERVGASLYNNLDFSIGIGQGLYLEGTVFDYVGVGAGAYVNYGSLQLNDGNWRFGQEIYSGATATVMGMDFGTASYSYREKGNTIDTNTWSVVDSKKDSVSIFSAKGYLLFLGASVDIGFDFGGFFRDLREIF